MQAKIVISSYESHSTEGRREVVHSLLTPHCCSLRLLLPSFDYSTTEGKQASGRPGPATG